MKNSLSDLERAAWAGFVVTQGKVFRVIEEDLRHKAGITHTEYEVLLRLSGADRSRERIQTLAEKSLLSRSGTSRAVERLEKAGFVKRTDAAEDGRGAYAVLTEEGRSHFEKTQSEHLRLVREVFLKKFDQQEQQQLAEFWKRFSTS